MDGVVKNPTKIAILQRRLPSQSQLIREIHWNLPSELPEKERKEIYLMCVHARVQIPGCMPRR